MKAKIKEWIKTYKQAYLDARHDVAGHIIMDMMDELNSRTGAKNRTPQSVQIAMKEIGMAGERIASQPIPFVVDEYGEPWGLHPDWAKQIMVQVISDEKSAWQEHYRRGFIGLIGWDYDELCNPNYGENTMLYECRWDNEGEPRIIHILLKSTGTIPQGSVWVSKSGKRWVVTCVEGDTVHVERYDENQEKWVCDWYGRKVIQTWKRVRNESKKRI